MTATQSEWALAQQFERAWWSTCTNTFCEETKQLTYAFKMGLGAFANNGQWPVYNLDGRRILDLGGGPVSLLLKATNAGPASMVMDPCPYPAWVAERYQAAGIGLWQLRGEDLDMRVAFDEVWIYNVLQHVEDPVRVIANARQAAPIIRLFEWINMAPCEGHPQMLTEAGLNEWVGGAGMTEQLDENWCQGLAYYGVFPT